MRRSALLVLAAFVTLLLLFFAFREYAKWSKEPPRAVPVMLTSTDADMTPTEISIRFDGKLSSTPFEAHS